MRLGYALMLGLAAAAPAPALAQGPAPVAVPAAPDPARLAASKAMIDVMLPPDRRDAMMRGIIEPMIANLRSGMESSPQFSALLASNPKAREVMLSFVDRQMSKSVELTLQSMPALMDAMAVVYARRFTVSQLGEITAFYRTPTGRELVEAMPSLVAAPEVLAVQKSMMTKAFENVQADAAQLVQQLAALQPKSETEKARP